mmetsp:Transcript_9040/g.26648  ORF Transcript_9040/g.26648 Transcript_9040/m.26648 type:complete len:226 (+) Transcript_9040:422-1099(+)
MRESSWTWPSATGSCSHTPLWCSSTRPACRCSSSSAPRALSARTGRTSGVSSTTTPTRRPTTPRWPSSRPACSPTLSSPTAPLPWRPTRSRRARHLASARCSRTGIATRCATTTWTPSWSGRGGMTPWTSWTASTPPPRSPSSASHSCSSSPPSCPPSWSAVAGEPCAASTSTGAPHTAWVTLSRGTRASWTPRRGATTPCSRSTKASSSLRPTWTARRTRGISR